MKPLERLSKKVVLDGDHSLIGEGLEQRDLSLREEMSLGAADVDGADRDTFFSDQGDAQYRAVAHAPRILTALREFGRLRLHVGDVDCLPGQNRSAITRPADEGKGGLDRDRAMMGDEAQVIAVPAKDGGVERFAEPGRALGNGVEHGLDVRGRA